MDHRSALPTAFILLIFALAAGPLSAQGIPDHAIFEMPGDTGRVSVPFTMINNHVVLEIMVNGEGPFLTVLDTGMPVPGLFLYGTEKSAALELEYVASNIAIGGAGGSGKRMTARLAQNVEFALGDLKIRKGSIIHSEPTDFGEYHDGIIGYSLFNRFVVELDYDNGLMHLIEPSKYAAPESAISLPIELRHNMPFVTVGVTAIDGSTYDAEVVIDIGARHAISLSVDSSDKISIPKGAIETQLGHGLSGKIEGSMGRLQSLRLGEFELSQVLASYPVSEHQSPRGMDMKNGNLGNGALRRFRTTFDYANGRMLLQPGRDFKKPFEHDMSGMRLRREGERIFVEEVSGETAAASAGLKAGDELVEVDGEPLSGAEVYGLRQRLQVEGAEFTLKVRRGDEMRTHRLRLSRRV